MSIFAIVLIALAVVLLLLFIGGSYATARRARQLEPALHARIQAANEALAEAHAQDKGWERTTIEAAARTIFEASHPGQTVDELHLVHVIDNPGTDADQAVFTVISGGQPSALTLGRRDGQWVAAT